MEQSVWEKLLDEPQSAQSAAPLPSAPVFSPEQIEKVAPTNAFMALKCMAQEKKDKRDAFSVDSISLSLENAIQRKYNAREQ
jgi:hypothetical protein